MSLLAALFSSCEKKKDWCDPQNETPHCICEYAVTPTFLATLVPEKSLFSPVISHDVPATDRLLIVVRVNNDEEKSTTRIVNYMRTAEEFKQYAKRWNDLSYNRPYPAPNTTCALLEPITKLRCYEQSASGEWIDVSDKMIFRALTYLPYIRSGYNDAIVPQYPKGLDGRWVYPTNYVVRKPLLDVTVEEMTLLDTKSWSYVFELDPIPPYELTEKSVVKILIEDGRSQEILVNTHS